MRMQHIATPAYVACNLSIDFLWICLLGAFLLWGARPQASVLWKASTRHGCQAPGSFLLESLHQKWVPGPRAFFWKSSTKNGQKAPGHPSWRPTTIQKQSRKIPENHKKYPKRNFRGENEKIAFFWQPGCHF